MSQPLPLLEQLRNLEHLQELDLKIDSLKRDKNSLPAGLKAIDESLNKSRGSVASKKGQIAELEKVHRQTQAAQDLNRDRLARANAKMEAVSNAQEFQAATKEIEQLKKLNQSLDEQNQTSSAEIEAQKKALASFEEELRKLQEERDSQETLLRGQDTKFRTDIASLLEDRSKYLSQIEPRILSQYDRIRAARGGLGIVPALGGRCKGCNMMVPPQLYNEVQRGTTLHSCPSCHRLLFIPESSQDSAMSSSKAATQ